jgi:hypothetical protein
MGYSYGQDDTPVMCFNAAKNWQLGWYGDRHSTATPLTASWNGEIVGIADYENDTILPIRSVAVKIAGDSSRDYYVSFNRVTGINSGSQEGRNQVLVHSRVPGTTYALSNLEAKLSFGGTFVIPSFGGGPTVTVQVNSILNTFPVWYADISVSADVGCLFDSDCDDGDFCNGAEFCSTGTCLYGVAPICSDGDPCTMDSCDSIIGQCVYPDNGSCCTVDNECPDNADACTSPVCSSGTCAFTTPTLNCCNVAAVCDDGVFCNGAEACVNNECVAGTAPSCDDGDVCTTDTCDAGSDKCSNVFTEGPGCVLCLSFGDFCAVDSDCCSNKCKGPNGGKQCK